MGRSAGNGDTSADKEADWGGRPIGEGTEMRQQVGGRWRRESDGGRGRGWREERQAKFRCGCCPAEGREVWRWGYVPTDERGLHRREDGLGEDVCGPAEGGAGGGDGLPRRGGGTDKDGVRRKGGRAPAVGKRPLAEGRQPW